MSVTSIEVEFDVDNDRFRFDLEGVFPLGVNWFVGVDGPYGEIKELDTGGAADAVGETPAVFDVSVSDPMDGGNYTFYVTAVDQDPLSKGPIALTYEFCFEPEQDFVLKVSDNCETLYVEDDTEYPTLNGNFNRSLIVRYPVITNLNTPGDATYTGEKIQQSMVQADGKIYGNVAWVVSGESSGDFEDTSDEWTIVYPVTFTRATNDYTVVCNNNPCSVLNCLDTYWSGLYSQIAQIGGVSNLPVHTKDQLALLTGALSLYRHAIDCNDNDLANQYYEQITSITSCDNSSDPVVISSPGPYGDDWVAVDSFENGYTTNGANPLMIRIINNAVYFKGGFDGVSWSTAGLKLIPLSFFEGLGVELSDGLQVTGADLTTNAAQLSTAVIYTEGGEVYVRTIQGHSSMATMGIFGVLLTK